MLAEGYAKVREPWVRLVERYQEAGLMRADVPAESVARTMIAAAQGFVAQDGAASATCPVDVLRERPAGSDELGWARSTRPRVDHRPVNVPETPAN